MTFSNKEALLVPALIASLLISHTALADESAEPSIQKTIDWAVTTCHDQSYGYSQEHRWGDGGYDCSSFVISAFWAGGFHLGYCNQYEGYTGDIKDAFRSAGFDWIPASDLDLDSGSTDRLLPGDVLLIDDYHAELYIGDGLTAAAHEDIPSDDHPNRSPAPGDQGDEVCVYEYVYHPWSGVLRYNSSNKVTSEPVDKNDSDEDRTESEGTASDVSQTDSGADHTGQASGETASSQDEAGQTDTSSGQTPVEAASSQDEAGQTDTSSGQTPIEAASSSSSSSSSDNSDTSLPATFEVVSSSLYVREGPGTDTPAVEYLLTGDRITVTGLTGVWGHVKVYGTNGYVNMMYLTRVAEDSEENAPIPPEETSSDEVAADDNKVDSETDGEKSSSNKISENADEEESNRSDSLLSYLSTASDQLLDDVHNFIFSVPLYPDGQVLMVDTETLFVRRDPSTRHDPIYALNKSQKVALLAQQGNWGKVDVEGITGWIDLRYCRS